MAVLTATTIGSRHILGDLVFRNFVMPAAVNNGDTLTVPLNRVESVIIQPTTNLAIGYTIVDNGVGSGSTITFVSASAWTGKVSILAREG